MACKRSYIYLTCPCMATPDLPDKWLVRGSMADARTGTRGTGVPPARLAEPPLCLQGPSMLQASAFNTVDNWLRVIANDLAGTPRTRWSILGGWNPHKRVPCNSCS